MGSRRVHVGINSDSCPTCRHVPVASPLRSDVSQRDCSYLFMMNGEDRPAGAPFSPIDGVTGFLPRGLVRFVELGNILWK